MSMQTTEKFNNAKLQAIINNASKFNDKFDSDYVTILRNYNNKAINDEQIVYYNQIDNQGRYFAKEGLSLQNLKRCIRHTIAGEYYTDVDMVNAHPVILQHLCKENGFNCDNLNDYITNREQILKETGIDRDLAKKQYLILTNSEGNEVEASTQHMFKYQKEMMKLHNQFYDLNPEEAEKVKQRRITNGKDENHKAAYMNSLLCEFENKLLMTMYEYFKKPNDCVLCFDGIMLKKGEYDIKGCMKFIKQKLKIDMKLKVKEMDDILDLSPFKIPTIKPITFEYWRDMKHIIGKTLDKKYVDMWMNSCISIVNKEGCLCYALKDVNGKKLLVNSSEFTKTVNAFNCNIINPKYDKDFSIKNPKSKDIKTKEYLYTSLGFGKNGYLNYCTSNGIIPIYYNIDYYPYLSTMKNVNIDNDTYNVFECFPMDDGKQYDTKLFLKSKWYKHLKTDFFTDEKEFEHFLDTIADMVQDPSNIKENAHLFYSSQGCGKGLLGQFLIKLLGDSNVATFNNTDLYFTSRFNVNASNKVLKIFEEVSEKGQAFSNHNRLKAEITAKTERVEKKGVDPYDVRNCSRYIFFTNNESTLYIENDDRRFTLHKINSKHAADRVYFAPIAREIENDDFIKSAFTFFATRKYDDVHVRTAFETAYKSKEKLVNLTNGVKYIIETIENKYTNVDVAENKTVTVGLVELLDEYSLYCTLNGFRYNAASFKTQIKKIGIEPKRITFDGKRKLCIAYNLLDLQSFIQTMIKNDKWKFDVDIIADKVKKSTPVVKKNKKLPKTVKLF
jgi:hypothetical protein